MKIDNEIKLDFGDVLIVPQRTRTASRQNVSLERTFKFYHSPREWTGVPIMISNMSCVAGIEMAIATKRHHIITCLHKYLKDTQVSTLLNQPLGLPYNWVSIGYNEKEINRLHNIKKMCNAQPNICIDVPNGYMDVFVEFCAKVRDNFPESIIMAGNVTTSDMTQELITHGGVDIVKTQIGPGSACRTRKMTGIGYGTLSCVIECSHTAHGLKSDDKRLGLICSDGGCKEPGDVCKALCGGSDFVMLGGYFAGAEECEGEWQYHTEKSDRGQVTIEEYQVKTDGFIEHIVKCGGMLYDPSNYGNIEDEPTYYFPKYTKQKKSFKFYGMSSHYAQEKHAEGKKNYRASEGDVIEIPYKGPVDGLIQELFGGIRSCCAYIGASNIKEMNKCAHFCRIKQ